VSRIEELQTTRPTPSPGPEPRQPSPMPVVNVNVHTPPAAQPPSPPDRSFVSLAPATIGNDKAQENDLVIKLAEAQNEIQRLRALLAATPDPAEIRRRTRALAAEEALASDGDAASDVGTSFPEQITSSRQDGASPQQVGIIALMVFIITYLFF
jgi:vesicle-associated membrane protein-associated protein A